MNPPQEATVNDATTQTEIPIARLRSDLNGQVIAPDDPAYDEARTVFSPLVDRRPAVVVRPADVREVARVVSLARETGLELAVRSGGHSGAGHGSARKG
jgi:FAD/FMN-containing dehydrogenase